MLKSIVVFVFLWSNCIKVSHRPTARDLCCVELWRMIRPLQPVRSLVDIIAFLILNSVQFCGRGCRYNDSLGKYGKKTLQL